MNYEVRNTADGSSTLFLPEINEQYHSLNGAVTESQHVFLNAGFNFHPAHEPVVFEVGFGTGLNALLTACLAEKVARNVFYIAIEKYPLNLDLIRKLNYGSYVPGQGNELFMEIHECQWEIPVQINRFFKLLKLKADFMEMTSLPAVRFDVVYFDAFGPDKQPEMWAQNLFSELYHHMMPQGVLVTYSAKGEVRRRLMAAGFKTEKLPGPPGKKEMLRAIK